VLMFRKEREIFFSWGRFCLQSFKGPAFLRGAAGSLNTCGWKNRPPAAKASQVVVIRQMASGRAVRNYAPVVYRAA